MFADYNIVRRRMIEEQLIPRNVRDERVLGAMDHLPRHLFVEEALQSQAYGDHPLGIGSGQTISQPYTVGLMTQALQLSGHEKVLEIGTGCGYQTAVLGLLAAQVYTIERIRDLGLKARSILKKLGYRNIVMRIGDGTQGWPQAAPFDRILIAAGSPKVPEPLVAQLAEGGILVLPVGNETDQELYRIHKRNGKAIPENLGPCRFVKLVGQHGWRSKKKGAG